MDNIIAFLFIFCVVIPLLAALAVLIAAAMGVILSVGAVAAVVYLCYTLLRGCDVAGTTGRL